MPTSPPASLGIFHQRVSLWMDCLELKEEEANGTIILLHLIYKFNCFKFCFSFDRPRSSLLDHTRGRLPKGWVGWGPPPHPQDPLEKLVDRKSVV